MLLIFFISWKYDSTLKIQKDSTLMIQKDSPLKIKKESTILFQKDSTRKCFLTHFMLRIFFKPWKHDYALKIQKGLHTKEAF